LPGNPTQAHPTILLEQPRSTRYRHAKNTSHLGEIIGQALEAKRDADTRTTLDALSPLTDTVTVREPTHDEDAVQLAVLFEVDRQGELERTVGDLAERWDNRVTMRILGPMAPYDFVVTPKPEG
ncbi:GvpL/GvpF family gas vesicle protein, partial [Rhodococcus wratislaviensis]|uniref:GvpL/GvpF family gas vesicle protein n=1 Tax=Rhodococcus wratislaviensis TaxID=44752 RepID=UPI0036584B60